MRLSVHYNVTEHSIKRANQFQLLGNHLDHLHGKLIRIPRVHGYIEAPAIDPARAAADERQRVIRTFQREAQCTEHEANYYLLDAEWNTALALQTLYADREWAAANPQTAAGRRPTTYVISPDGTRMVPSVIGGDAQKAAENAASGETACNDCE